MKAAYFPGAALIAALAAAALAAAALAAAGPVTAEQGRIPAQSVDQALRARLPAEILAAGEMVSVNNGSFPPHEIVVDAHTLTGASAGFARAVAEQLRGG